MFGEDLSMRVEFRTINGICAKAIAMYSRMVGKQAFELLSDEGEKARILAGIISGSNTIFQVKMTCQIWQPASPISRTACCLRKKLPV